MKRYLSRQVRLTDAERLASYAAAVREAQEELESAVAQLKSVLDADIPTHRAEYFEVKPGEPGYEDAPFENSIIMDAREIQREIANRPSPWLGLVERGTFPGGLTKP